MEGKVKWFNRDKGYGFIEGDDGSEYFVHHSALNGVTFLRDLDRVSFEATETERGKQARNVTLLQKGSEMAEQGEDASHAEESAPAAEEPAQEAPVEEAPASEEAPAEQPTEEAPASEETPAEQPAEEQQ